MKGDEALRIVDSLYAAALGETAWPDALALIADGLGSSAATLEFHDVSNRRLLAFESARVDPDLTPIYLEHFAWRNPRTAFLRSRTDTVSFDHMFMTEGEMDRHPFYAEFLAPFDMRYFMAAQTPLLEGRVKGVLSVQRSGRVRGVVGESLDAMRMLAPHIDRALALYWSRMRREIDPEHLDCALARHGLTPAERRLARALASGETVPDFARRTGVSMNTAYTHYGRVKQKLDCGRQAALVARLQAL